MQGYVSKIISFCVFTTALLSSWQIHASNQIILSPSGSNKLSVIENSTTRLLVTNSLSSFNTLSLKTDKGEFVELMVDSYSKSNKVGAPQLPVLSKLIEIPAGTTAEVSVISYDIKEYKLSDFGITQKLFPAQPPQSKNSNRNVPIEFNKQLYATNSFYGEALAKVEIAGYLRTVQLANLILSPVEYNPVINSIRVYDNLIIEIRFSGAGEMKSAENKNKTQSPYFSNVFTNVLNYQPEKAMPVSNSGIPVKYVIVSDPMFRESLQPFIKWKIKRGFNVTEAYTDDPAVGKTTQSIKSYLQNLYTSATTSDPAPTFVLFVGDVDQIPAFSCGDHVSDLYYCEYTGDYLPEVFYGRFSANNVTELQPQIDKTLQYEQFLMPDPSFLSEVVLTAGADGSHQARWGNGQVNYGTLNYFNAAHNFTSHVYLQPELGGGNYSQKIQANISHGVSYANYSAHGSREGWSNPLFSIADIAKLQNAGKYGLIVANSCQTSSYNLNSFGEEIVRAENKGALAYIGASDLTFWDEDYWWSVGNGSIVTNPTYETTGLGAFDRMFHNHGEARSEGYSTTGQMVFAGNLAVQASNSDMKKYYWEIYCLMGDPSTMIYFSVPPAMVVDYNPLLPIGTSTFEVRTEPFANVAISKNSKLNGVAEADENGLAVVSLLSFPETGYANIVVTKQNRQPFIDSVKVAIPEGSYLLPSAYAIKDEGGNNNGLPEPGEPFNLDISLKNVGLSDARNAISTLTTNDKYLTILSNTHTWPMIQGSETASALNAFTLGVNDYVPDMHKAVVKITTQTATNKFESEFGFLVYAPNLQNGNITFDDSTAGNGNGHIDPGETIFVSIPTVNTGHCASAEVRTKLFVAGQYVASNSKVVNLGSLTPGAIGTSIFSFTVSPDALRGSSFNLFASAEAGPYNSVSSLEPIVGQQVEDFEKGDFSKYNWQMKGNKPWEISPVTRSEGLFGVKSGAVNNSERSELNLEGLVLCSDTMSFYHKVSSEWGYDFLKFFIDGVERSRWSGNNNWTKASYPVTAGNHKFSWIYEKDEANVAGQDAAWIDYIRLPAFNSVSSGPVVVTVLAEPASICEGEQSQLYVFAPGGTDYNYHWSASTSLSDTSVFNPLANPSETTAYIVQVNGKSFSATGQVLVHVEEMPFSPVVTVSDGHLVSSATAGNQWYKNDGMIHAATAQTYYPGASGTYYAIVANANGCLSTVSNKVEFVFTGIDISSQNDFSVYPNPFTDKLYVEYNVKTAGEVKIVIYNAMGNEVGTIEEGEKAVGNHQVVFNGTYLPSGIFVYRIYSGDSVKFARVIKVK